MIADCGTERNWLGPSPHTARLGLNPDATAFVAPTTSVTMCAGVDKTVLLQIAQASVYNPSEPQLSMRVRAVAVSDRT